MEESPRNNNNGIKLFGATITLHDRKQQQSSRSRSRSSDDNKDPATTEGGADDNTKSRPDKIIACPRCKSMETKFCYFNNYNVNQPRHFCKGCQRYWTAGGALRNVPVGAGRRKNKPVPCTAATANCGLYYDANNNPPDDVVRHYLDLQGTVVVENSWHLMAAAAAQSEFRQVAPSVKRRRNGEVDS